MPVKTDFGDLTLYSATGQDAEQTFLKFRTDIAGTNPDSNFNKIANILSLHDFSIKNSRKIFDITAQKVSENYYESNDSEIDDYYPYMILDGKEFGGISLWKTMTIGGTAKINIGGMWKKAIPYVKSSGTWEPAISYIKSDSNWKRGKV